MRATHFASVHERESHGPPRQLREQQQVCRGWGVGRGPALGRLLSAFLSSEIMFAVIIQPPLLWLTRPRPRLWLSGWRESPGIRPSHLLPACHCLLFLCLQIPGSPATHASLPPPDPRAASLPPALSRCPCPCWDSAPAGCPKCFPAFTSSPVMGSPLSLRRRPLGLVLGASQL